MLVPRMHTRTTFAVALVSLNANRPQTEMRSRLDSQTETQHENQNHHPPYLLRHLRRKVHPRNRNLYKITTDF